MKLRGVILISFATRLYYVLRGRDVRETSLLIFNSFFLQLYKKKAYDNSKKFFCLQDNTMYWEEEMWRDTSLFVKRRQISFYSRPYCLHSFFLPRSRNSRTFLCGGGDVTPSPLPSHVFTYFLNSFHHIICLAPKVS